MKTSFTQLLARVFLLSSAIAFLCSCAGGYQRTNLENEEFPEQFGVVVVQVVSNSIRLSHMLTEWNNIFVVDVNNPENQFMLEPHGNGLIRSQVFAGRLPPGQYSVKGLWSNLVYGDVTYTLFAPGPDNLGTFYVQENRISSLGTLVFQPLDRLSGARLKTESPFIISRFDDSENLGIFVAEAYPDIYQNLNPTTLLGWQPDVYEDFRSLTNSTINQISVGLEYQWLGDDRITMTGPLGKIMYRDPASRIWNHADTGFNIQLTTIIPYRDGYLSAGERGIVLQSDSLDGAWRQVPGPSSQEAVYWMHYEPDSGLFALARKGNDVYFYKISEGFEWESVMKFTFEAGFWSVSQRTVFATSPGDGTLVIFGDEKRVVYDMHAGSSEIEQHQKLRKVIQQPDSTLLHYAPKLLNFRKDEVSFNFGKDWEEIRRVRNYEQWQFETASYPIVLNQEDVLAISHRGYLKGPQIEYQEEPRVRRAKHQAKKINGWGEAIPKACTNLLPQISTPTRIFALCYDGSLIRSEDQGRTWELDYRPGVIKDNSITEGIDSSI